MVTIDVVKQIAQIAMFEIIAWRINLYYVYTRLYNFTTLACTN